MLKLRRILAQKRAKTAVVPFDVLFRKFQEILAINNRVVEQIAEANDKLGGDYIFDRHYIETMCRKISERTLQLVHDLDSMAPHKYLPLFDAFRRIQDRIDKDLQGGSPCGMPADLVLFYADIGRDYSETVGGKNANLAEVGNFLGLDVPQGFAITSAAYCAFMQEHGLKGQIGHFVDSWFNGTLTLDEASRSIRELIVVTPLPLKLERALAGAVSRIMEKGAQSVVFAVRSSAWGEDGQRSFAGQYESFLNVPGEGVADAYRQVVASAYSENAMTYRRKIGFDEDELMVAAGCQVMIDAASSGVLYTLDPTRKKGSAMLVSATWGLGAHMVSGTASADRFVVCRDLPHRIREMDVVRKEAALVPARFHGMKLQPVVETKQTMPSLTNTQVRKVAETGLLIEKYFKKSQDIEFAFDADGKLIILQARPLHISPDALPKAADLSAVLRRYPVLLRNQGEVAQKGIASGAVFVMRSERDLDDFPTGAILVARFASPLLAKVIARASAILTDVGSVTGHLATIAREFRVPCIVNGGNVSTLLSSGLEITVDAEENIIYQGVINELCVYGLTGEEIEETPEYRLLRRVLRNVAPLHLLDPAEKNFIPGACSSLHDIIRFVHEKAVEELIERNYYQQHHPQTIAGRLCWNIPLDLVLIDVGGGLKQGVRKGRIVPEAINSFPMQQLLKGLEHPMAWNNEPMSVDLGSFMSSLTRTFSPELSTPKQVGQNLAVISKQYANVSLRLGYHFTMIDSYISENINDNYVYFRFFGGVTDQSRRSRRAKFLGEILISHDFRVEVHGDLVVARIKKVNKQGMKKRLYLLGMLVGFTRQLDVRMVSDQHVDAFKEKFNQLIEVDI